MGKPHSLSHYSSRSIGWPEPQGEKRSLRHSLIGSFPQITLFPLLSFHHYFGLETKIQAKKPSKTNKKTSNSIDAYLFVEHSCTLVLSMLFGRSSFCGFVQFHLFTLIWFRVCVCLEQCYIWEWMACLDGLGWHFFRLYWLSGVCPNGWGRTCTCHSCRSHTHACPCEEWAALSPLLFS